MFVTQFECCGAYSCWDFYINLFFYSINLNSVSNAKDSETQRKIEGENEKELKFILKLIYRNNFKKKDSSAQ